MAKAAIEGAMRSLWSIRILTAGAAFLPAVAGAQDCAGDDGRIDWEVQGRFALFKEGEARKAGDALLAEIERAKGNLVAGSPAGEAERNDAYEAIVAALTRDDDPLYLNTEYNRETELYETQFLTPPSYRVTATFSGETDPDCDWTVAGRSKRGRCAGAELDIGRDWSRPATATPVEVRSASGRTARACILVEEKLIVGLGDSYASGEGNPDRPTRWDRVEGLSRSTPRPMQDGRSQLLWWTSRKGPLKKVEAGPEADAQWWDNVCHRSLLSQQALAAMAYAARSRRRVTTFLSFACSGATIVDGLVGPRVDTPGMGRLKTEEARKASPALTRSQIAQAVTALCETQTHGAVLPLPGGAPAWAKVKPQYAPSTPGKFEIPRCETWRRRPDILLLTIGGNDVGFGGVGWWAIVPPNGRIPLPADIVTWLNTSEDRDAKKGDFGVVCPRTYGDERRCRKSKYSAQALAQQLPSLQALAEDALATAGLVAPVQIKTGYPPVTRDEVGMLCGRSWSLGNAYRLEPWASTYSQVLSRYRFLGIPLAAPIFDWTWGIRNDETTDSECPRGEDLLQQIYEICEIDSFVLESLNRAVLAPRPGWTNVDQDRLPRTHGICAGDSVLKGEGDPDDWTAFRREWGFPRWRRGGWNGSYPIPAEWKPYARRQRWVRTANDSALTQAAFYGGLGTTGKEEEKERLGDSNSGSLHATVQMHAAYAELLVEKIEEMERQRGGRAGDR